MKISLLKKTAFLFIALLTSAILNAQNIYEIEVAPKKYDCVGVGPQTCYKVRFKDSSDWQYMYEEIEGFVYQPGNYYRILIKIEKNSFTPADASSRKISFIEMIEKTPAPSESGRLGNGSFTVVSYRGKTLQVNDTFVLQNGAFRFHYCNYISGKYSESDNEKISFYSLISTKMACIDQKPSEYELLNDLQKVNKYTLSGGSLKLFYNNEKLFEFEKTETFTAGSDDRPVAVEGASKSFYGTTTVSLFSPTDSAIVKRKLGRKLDLQLFSQTGKGMMLLQRDPDSKAGKLKLKFKDLESLEYMQIKFSTSTSYTTSFFKNSEIHRENILLPTKDPKTLKLYQEQIKVKRLLAGGYSLVVPASIMAQYINIYITWKNKNQ